MNVQLFKAMSDKTRLKILEYIKENPNSVCCDIAKHVKKDASTTCRHIEVMKKAGLVETKRNGKYITCSLKDAAKTDRLMETAKSIGGR